MFLLHLVLFLFICVCLVFFWRKQTEYYDDPSSCIITMTTYLGFEDRFDHLDKILKPLDATGQTIVVINEWDENCHTYVGFMETHYPEVVFIQKPEEDKGQARSLNILVRDYLLHSDKKYWVHWEDTWVATRPLLPDLVYLMDQHPQVSQLQVTDDWKKMPPSHTIEKNDITIIKPQHPYHQDVYEMKDRITLDEWPLFSLRPSINRLSFFQRHANDFYFLEHPHMWPLLFEWEFGRIFLRNKGVKAITNQPYAKRIKGHRSTYADMFTSCPHSTR
jgi:hypothetical protein